MDISKQNTIFPLATANYFFKERNTQQEEMLNNNLNPFDFQYVQFWQVQTWKEIKYDSLGLMFS